MRSSFLPAILLTTAISVSASAAPVTYEFSGLWNGGYGSTLPEWHDFGIPLGTAFSGTFTLETETPAAYAIDHFATYTNPFTSLTLDVGPGGQYGQYFLSGPYPGSGGNASLVTVIDDFDIGYGPIDQFGANLSLTAAPGDDPSLHRWLQFNAYSGPGIPWQLYSSGLPVLGDAFTVAQQPDFLSHLSFSFAIANEGSNEDYRYASVDGQITDLHEVTASVPEPATLSLLGIGLLGAAAARRRPSR